MTTTVPDIGQEPSEYHCRYPVGRLNLIFRSNWKLLSIVYEEWPHRCSPTSICTTCSIYARTTIVSDRDQAKKLNIGYSDDVSVFLNGGILYRGRSAQRFHDPGFLGIVNAENDAVYLSLKKGNNELVLAVSELTGGGGSSAGLTTWMALTKPVALEMGFSLDYCRQANAGIDRCGEIRFAGEV